MSTIIPVEAPPMGYRSPTPDGPWDNEPDAARVICGDIPAVLRRNGSGAWCGYLGFPESHPTHGHEYNDHYDDWSYVHGCWTFSEYSSDLDRIAGLEGLWWIGFDCAHSGDLVPAFSNLWPNAEYRDINYAAAELERTAEHFAKIAAR